MRCRLKSTADFENRQYFQCANQVEVSRARRNFYEEDYHKGTDLCFGLLSGYPCCTCNMHQGWPKFVQNLWYATADGGLAALRVCRVLPSIGGWPMGCRCVWRKRPTYPFEETVRFRIQPERSVRFPLRLRVPAWASSVVVKVNGEVGGGSNLRIAC